MGTDVLIGRLEAAEFADFRRVFAQTFGFTMSEEKLAQVRPWSEVDRAVAARAGGQIVGTSGAYTFELTLPWADPVGCAGITVVSVRADHRRRGVLTDMMRRLFEDADERGEPFAALWASEAPIYGRFGFGPAAPTIGVEVERQHARLRSPADVAGVHLISAEDAAARFPAIYDAEKRRRHGMLGFGHAWWERLLDDDPDARAGAGEARFALLEDRGCAIYRLKEDWTGGVPGGEIQVHELFALDPDAAATLWQFVIDTDLGGRIRSSRRPADEPLPLLMQDEGRAKITADWPMYVALVDLPVALAARGYAVDDTLTLRVHDRFWSRNDGSWRLSIADGKATCEPTDGDADLELDADVLGALVLGGQRVTRYAAAGRLQAHTPDAVVRAERLLATDVAPWNGIMF